MRVIVYTTPQGSLAVVRPASSEEAAWRKLPKDAIGPRWVDDSELPATRDFRNAWKDDNGVKVDMPKAREIHKKKLRELRAPKLQELDVEYQKADEIGDVQKKKAVAAKKQELRDVTELVDSASTVEELTIPEILK